MMMRNILVLACNDLAIAFRNKTFFLILFIPLFVFVSLDLVDGTRSEAGRVRIGLVQGHAYPPGITGNVNAADKLVEVTWVQNEAEGVRLLKEHKIDGILTGKEKAPGSLALLVLKKDSLRTIAIVQDFSALQKAAEGSRPDWITNIRSLHQSGVQRETLPTWILMLVLLIGFIILPAQVAEEKEKKLLIALLQTPIHEAQWLIAKLILGMVLIVTAVLFLHLLGGFGPVHLPGYIAFIVAGSFCFSAYGIFLGFLCRNQASARTLGVIFYLPHLLPSAMSDVSQKLTSIAPLLPSYQLYEPLQSILLEDGRLADMTFDWVYLLLLGSVMFFLSYLLMKRRWLM
ncbi:MAG: putative ABC-type transporter, multidrug permease component [Candidatus Gallionella acididurans]|uniref:Putative ABC-type transporter, multidrug permease component n=1 Tax=Candidatus Gallionella acididurans TaxID=1796491 RepID=A0A139BR96_9PROT|nr:MAG: putative ABC-type transporter, multidrug permease component [Candidatus Gallionella acididurans]